MVLLFHFRRRDSMQTEQCMAQS